MGTTRVARWNNEEVHFRPVIELPLAFQKVAKIGCGFSVGFLINMALRGRVSKV